MRKIIFPNVSLFPEGFFNEPTSLDVIHTKKKGSMAKVFKINGLKNGGAANE